jgi:hypothetical protein
VDAWQFDAKSLIDVSFGGIHYVGRKSGALEIRFVDVKLMTNVSRRAIDDIGGQFTLHTLEAFSLADA